MEPATPSAVAPPRPASALAPMATPQAIAVPIMAPRRSAPGAMVVFAAYALLGAAIVLLAGALRWTRVEHGAAAGPAVATCPSGMSRVAATEGGATTSCQVTPSPATSSMRVISAPGPTRIGGPQ